MLGLQNGPWHEVLSGPCPFEAWPKAEPDKSKPEAIAYEVLGKIFSAHKLKLSYFQLNSNIRIDVVLFLNDIFCGVGISELYFTLSKGCQEMSKHSRTL